MKLAKADVEIEYIRASGPGGQHRNKNFTGVRLKHIPTGLVAHATERRSRAQNLEAAWKRLTERVTERLRPRRRRIPTKPTRASRRRRLDDKKRHGRKKSMRRDPRADD